MKSFLKNINKYILVLFAVFSVFIATAPAYAITLPTSNYIAYTCGGTGDTVQTSIDFGCEGKGNPILDLTFAIIRFLSDGVGIVLVGSLIVGGIMYTTSRGDPNAVAKAVKRIQSVMSALFLYIFAYAILNYLLPGITLK